MKRTHTILVKINAERPDFRVFASYFFGDDLHDFDSDGNSYPVTSKQWTELYMSSREVDDMSFDIVLESEEPLIFEVASDKMESMYVIAYFLARETKGEVLDAQQQSIPLERLIPKMGSFNVSERLKIADNSIWRLATEENPYPNLTLYEVSFYAVDEDENYIECTYSKESFTKGDAKKYFKDKPYLRISEILDTNKNKLGNDFFDL